MTERDPVSVLLPTMEWNTACEQLAAQLKPNDELLVVCDSERDPVAGHDPPAVSYTPLTLPNKEKA